MNEQRRGAIPAYLKQHQTKKYQPEHKVHDLQTTQPGSEQTPAILNPFAKRALSPRHNVPPGRSLPVQVGNNEEQLWMDDSVIGVTPIKIKANQYIDNNDYVNVEALQSRKFKDEAVTYPEEENYSQPEPKKQSQIDSIVSALNESLVPGEYIVYCGEVIVKSYDIQDVRGAIEHLVLNNIAIEDIFVCKRLNINFGAIIDS